MLPVQGQSMWQRAGSLPSLPSLYTCTHTHAGDTRAEAGESATWRGERVTRGGRRVTRGGKGECHVEAREGANQVLKGYNYGNANTSSSTGGGSGGYSRSFIYIFTRELCS